MMIIIIFIIIIIIIINLKTLLLLKKGSGHGSRRRLYSSSDGIIMQSSTERLTSLEHGQENANIGQFLIRLRSFAKSQSWTHREHLVLLQHFEATMLLIGWVWIPRDIDITSRHAAARQFHFTVLLRLFDVELECKISVSGCGRFTVYCGSPPILITVQDW